ncbi:MAG: AraC family transcriptional regulator [Sphingomonas sp.]|nr:AraC family transcriptional regulator [Sphingomonas sp.]
MNAAERAFEQSHARRRGGMMHADWYRQTVEPSVALRPLSGGAMVLSRNQPIPEVDPPPLALLSLQIARGRDTHRMNFGEGAFTARLGGGGTGFVVAPAGHANRYEVVSPIDLLAIDLPDWATLDAHGEPLRAIPGLHGRMYTDPLVEGCARHLWDIAPTAPKLETDGLTVALVALLKRLVEEQRPRGGGLTGWQVRRCEEYLRENLAENVSLAEVAELARLSPFHFARQFKATMGLPPAAYQRKLRLERAQEMLLGTDLEVGEIAVAVGYETPQAFARAFRQGIGASPSDWRRERRR